MLGQNQLDRICKAILARVPTCGEPWWSNRDRRPSDRAFVAKNGLPLSSGEQLLVQVAVDVWNGHGGAGLRDIVNVLDGPNLRMVGSLLVALGSDDGAAVAENWLAQYEAPALARRVGGAR